MNTNVLKLITLCFVTACTSSRYEVSRIAEPFIETVFTSDDGRVLRNRPRLEATIESIPHSERYSYLVVREKGSGAPIAVEPLAGREPKAYWLPISASDNKLLIVVDGGGSAGPNVMLFAVRWSHENADAPTGHACHFCYLHRQLNDNLVGGQFRVETNSAGYAIALEYEVEDMTDKGRFYSKKRIPLDK